MDSRHLFRGKRVKSLNENWEIGHYVSVPRPMIVLEELQQNGNWYWFEVDPSTIERCTGAIASKSYRGERAEDLLIWEGDVLSARHALTQGYYFGTSARPARFVIKHEDACLCAYNDQGHRFLLRELSDIEIIGTVHDAQEGAKTE